MRGTKLYTDFWASGYGGLRPDEWPSCGVLQTEDLYISINIPYLLF